MKKILLIVICMSSVASAWADWIKLGTTEDGNVVWHMESGSLEVVSVDIRRIKFLYNDMKAGRSVMTLDEFNCNQRKTRTTRAKSYNKLLANGKPVVEVDEPTKWEAVSRGSTSDNLMQIACRGFK
jgi:hypothetical protein